MNTVNYETEDKIYDDVDAANPKEVAAAIKEFYGKQQSARVLLKEIAEDEYQINKRICELEKIDKQFKLEDGVRRLQIALSEDRDLYYAYQSNIAMSFVDEVSRSMSTNYPGFDASIRRIANRAAKDFLNIFIGGEPVHQKQEFVVETVKNTQKNGDLR